MSIDRKKLIARYNPVLTRVELTSPLTVGNGELGFTVDVTGLQSLYEEYRKVCPLCTMSQWGWHTTPVSSEKYRYDPEELELTEYCYQGRTVRYPQEIMPGNEEVYHWLRQNPHRLNLARIGFLYRENGLQSDMLEGIRQELDLYSGMIHSSFTLAGQECRVQTCCDPQKDCLAIRAESSLLKEGTLSVALDFPYGSPDMTGSDWDHLTNHETEVLFENDREIRIKRTLDHDTYYVSIRSVEPIAFSVNGHRLILKGMDPHMNLSVLFTREPNEEIQDFDTICRRTEGSWAGFWETGGMIKVSSSTDERAEELQRRVILSLYLLAVNSSGSMPPQETGLTCNSWFGKMHLEMHFWHSAWSPLWGHGELLKRSFDWYVEHLPQAEENARKNGFRGCRWPKMTAADAVDSPSNKGPLLIWQQPHIIMMLELVYRENPNKSFLEKYWVLVKETADFMVDFAVENRDTGYYELLAPLIPVQECHAAIDGKNPVFEVEYWKNMLSIAIKWSERLGRETSEKWREVCTHMAPLPTEDGVYLAQEGCSETFSKFNIDHPSMLGALGVLSSERVDRKVMAATLEKVINVWDYKTLWGWDFAVMAMTAARLGKPDLAVDCLMMDTAKNHYVISGNNSQGTRKELPLYLPGNGSLLLAVAYMTAGSEEEPEHKPIFPDTWLVEWEGIEKYL